MASTPQRPVTAVTPPAAPSDVFARGLEVNAPYVTWTDASSNQTDFLVERREAERGIAGLFSTVATCPPARPGSWRDRPLRDHARVPVPAALLLESRTGLHPADGEL
ncbi:MAG: hypothetical protein HY901_24160 [Deltaproteobacteria bacterium]|nr:hypothetical protein [Deltaproteobacteria bacterium]